MQVNIIDRDPEQVIYEIKELIHEELIKSNTVTKVLKEMLPDVKVLDVLHMSLAVEVYCLKEAIRRYDKLVRMTYVYAGNVLETKSNLIARMFPDKHMLDMPVLPTGTHTLRESSAKNMLGTIKHHFKDQGAK